MVSKDKKVSEMVKRSGRGFQISKDAKMYLINIYNKLEKCPIPNLNNLVAKRYINSTLEEIITYASGFALKFGWKNGKMVHSDTRKRFNVQDIKYVLKHDLKYIFKRIQECRRMHASLK